MRALIAVIALVFCLADRGGAMADTQTFTEDESIQETAEILSKYALITAKDNFGIELDWTDDSIEKVETILSKLHESYVTSISRPTDELVLVLSKMFGSYVGEVYRRNHGGAWGIVNLNGQTFPGIMTPSGVIFWPWGRAQNRILNGAENNVADYYRLIVESARN